MSNKIKQCKVCGKDIATSAKVCPYCGAKKQKPIFMRWWFIVLTVFIILGVIGNLGGTDTDTKAGAPAKVEEKEPEIEYTEYTVDELIKDLEKNAASAKDKYDGQYVELTGKLSSIDSDGRYFGIKPSGTGIWFENVTCYIKKKDQKERLKEMKTGDTITVKGKITDVGEILGYDLHLDSIE